MADAPNPVGTTPTAAAHRPVTLRQVPASRGARWVRQGFKVFARKPLAFSALVATFLFVALLLLLVPFSGPLLLLAAFPLASLGFMIASQVTLHGQVPLPMVFVAPLRRDPARRSALIRQCIAYAVCTLVVIYLSEWIDGGRFEQLQELLSSGSAEPDQVAALMGDPRLTWGMVSRLGLTSLLSIPFWHAPALVHWCGQGFGQSLFSSTLACWRNRGAYVVYALAWVALMVGVLAGASLIFGLLGTPQLMTLLALPVVMLFTTVFYASLFFTFVDCFEIAPAATASGAPDSADTPA